MACDEILAARVREILLSVAGFSEWKLFGGLCYLNHGSMCCGVLKDEMILRPDPERAQELLNRPRTRPTEQGSKPASSFIGLNGYLLP